MTDKLLAKNVVTKYEVQRLSNLGGLTRLKVGIAMMLYMSISIPSYAAQEPAKLACLIKPEMYVDLSSSIDAIVDEVLVKNGDYIVKGQPLINLEASVEKARVDLAKIQAASNSEINTRQVQLQFAKQNKKHIDKLHKKNMISEFEFFTATTEVSLAEIELVKALENKRLATLNLEVAKSQLALRSILSPINGVVVERYAMVGESVTDRSIMKLAQIDTLRVELIAPTEYFGLITKGMDVKVYTEKPINQTFQAQVSMVDQLIDPASGSFSVHMTVPNPGDQLVSGVNCLASFNFDTPVPSNPSLGDSYGFNQTKQENK